MEFAIKSLQGSSPLLPLTKGVAPAASGIYALYHKERLVYLGMVSRSTTKSKRSLRSRLNEHIGKIESRVGITLDEMKCRFLTFNTDWWVFAAEYALIEHYGPEWNATGFGSKVPGRGRPGTERVSVWDKMYPKENPSARNHFRFDKRSKNNGAFGRGEPPSTW